MWPFKKLSRKYQGFYKIIAQSNIHLFTLHFPEFIYSIHSIFYISMLETIISNIFSRQLNLLSVLVTIDSEIEYEIVNYQS